MTRRNAVGSNKQPFAFTALGTRFYVITQAKHATEVDKNMDTLSFDEFVHEFVRTVGLNETSIHAFFLQKLPRDKAGFPNPSGDALGTITRQMHVHQLHPGEYQRILESRFLNSFNRDLRLERINGLQHSNKTIEVSLYRWCANFFTRAGEYAYFGPVLARIDPDFADVFYAFDELSWQITYQIPKIFANRLVTAQTHLHQSLKKYFQTPSEQRTDQAWFTAAAEQELRSIGIGDDDIATLFLTIYLT